MPVSINETVSMETPMLYCVRSMGKCEVSLGLDCVGREVIARMTPRVTRSTELWNNLDEKGLPEKKIVNTYDL